MQLVELERKLRLKVGKDIKKENVILILERKKLEQEPIPNGPGK